MNNKNFRYMKKKPLFLMLSMACCTALQVQSQDWGNLSRYAQDNRAAMQQSAETRRVVFMGNSITENWMRYHPDFFTGNGYVGRGISGQTSYQFLVRFREDVICLQPELVVLNTGTNDIAENTGPYNEDYTFGNIVSMAELAQANHIKVILTSVLPAAAFPWNSAVKDAAPKIAKLNERIARYAEEKGIPYVNYYEQLAWGDDKALNPAYTKDGVHPTPDGYVVMEALIKKAIEEALKP